MKFISYIAGLSIYAASVAALPSLNLPDFDPLTEYAKLLKMCKEDPNPNTVCPVKVDLIVLLIAPTSSMPQFVTLDPITTRLLLLSSATHTKLTELSRKWLSFASR
jgi:hypothetical protein